MLPDGASALPRPGPQRRITRAMDLHAVSCACLLFVSCRTSSIGLRKLAPMESGLWRRSCRCEAGACT